MGVSAPEVILMKCIVHEWEQGLLVCRRCGISARRVMMEGRNDNLVVECPVKDVKGPQLTVGSFEFGPEAKARKFEFADGYDFWRWPEWQALAKRLGIDLGAPTTALTFHVKCNDLVRVVHEFTGMDLNTSRE